MASTATQLTRTIVLSAVCIALNVGLNKIAAVLQLPVFMDSVGTILSAALVPPLFSCGIGIISNLLGGVITNPAIPFFAGTQLVIAAMAITAYRFGWFRRLGTAVLTGLAIGVVSAVVSAPITVIMFGGVTQPGATAVNAILMASGHSLWTSVLTGSLLVSSVDKVVACVVAWVLLQRLPERLKRQ